MTIKSLCKLMIAIAFLYVMATWNIPSKEELGKAVEYYEAKR